MNLCADLKNAQKDEIEKARQQGYDHATQNSINSVQDRSLPPEEEKADNEALMNVLMEESANLKQRIIQLTESNNALKAEKTKLTITAGAEFREVIER